MEIGKKAIAIGAGIILLGGLGMGWLISQAQRESDNPGTKHTGAMQAAIAQLEQTRPAEAQASSDSNTSVADDTPEMTHAAFLAEAEERRAQKLEDKAEAERREKLLTAKKNSVECKFWKQQQKTSSAAAKIDEKIAHYCTLQSSTSSVASATSENTENI